MVISFKPQPTGNWLRFFLCSFVKKTMAASLPPDPTDQQIMDFYLQKITSDFRTCYTGLDLLKDGFKTGNINSMVMVMKQFFVGVAMMDLVDFQELQEVRPGLLTKNEVYFDTVFPETMYVMQRQSVKERNLSFTNCEVTLEISSGMRCMIQAYNSKITIKAYGTAYFEMQYGGEESEINIILYGTSAGILINLNNAGPYILQNNGSGIFKYIETNF